ncbi:MAG: hypothetical protein HC938_17355, partial [Nitrospira sp.]|nr:hypothetical protein [Nitrospira sp.]
MMTDLRGFTAMSERLAPEQVVGLLNGYFEVMLEVIARYQGTINEIVNGLRGKAIALGLIPLGTANVLADEIGLRRHPRYHRANFSIGLIARDSCGRGQRPALRHDGGRDDQRQLPMDIVVQVQHPPGGVLHVIEPVDVGELERIDLVVARHPVPRRV